MDDKVPDFLEFEAPILSSSPKNENALKLDDPPEHDPFVLQDSGTYPTNEEKKDVVEYVADDLLNLGEPPAMENESDRENDDRVEISKFAEEFVKPIVKEAIAMHKSEAEDDESEVHGESAVDKKSDKSSSDDGFEHVKKEEVEKEETQPESESPVNEAEEVKRDLEDLVFQEEMRLESNSENMHDFSEENADGISRELLEDDVIQQEDDIKDQVYEEVEERAHANIAFSAHPEFEDLDKAIEYETHMELPEVNNVKIESDVEDIRHNIISSNSEDHFQEEIKVEPCIRNEHIMDATEPNVESEPLASIIKVEHDINGKCKDIINWTHPVSSALAFSILMFIELGLMMDYSIISLLAYSGLLLMVASFVYKIAVNFRLINTQSSMNCIITFNKEDVEYCVDVTLDWVDYIHKEIKSIAYVQSFSKNIKAFAMLWVLTYVGQMFNLQSLIFIGSLLLFSMPVVYTKFEKEIDAVVERLRGDINGTINKIKSKTQRLFGIAAK